VGRKYELAIVQRLLADARLLTLVGGPGTGKTRLALQAGQEVAASFPQGVFFVSLAPLNDATLVLDAIAGAVGVTAAHDRPLLATLKHFLQASRMLLILDNCEHVLAGVAPVAELLAAVRGLKVLATSREPLHLYGEQEYTVPPLEMPDSRHVNLQTLTACESVTLFVQRARAVRPDFELTPENSLAVAKICVRLEGLPLAIELAAARIKLLPPQALLARLGNPLAALTGGAQNLPLRQQTLYNTIAWSYDLLRAAEQQLFARLAVFRDGHTLEAAEIVCRGGLAYDVLDGLASLVSKSLVQQRETVGGEVRFVMLETIHAYAGERLAQSHELEAMRHAHAAYFAALAEQAEQELRGAHALHWMMRLEQEDNNLRAALSWSLGSVDPAASALGLRLAAAVRDFWIMSNRFVEAEEWLRQALALCRAAAPELRVRVLTAAGIVFFYAPGGAHENELLAEAIEEARRIGDEASLAWALTFQGAAAIGAGSGYGPGRAAAEEGLALFRRLGDQPGMAQALNVLGELARTHGDDADAAAAYTQCLSLVRVTGERRREAMILSNLGSLAMHRGEVRQAQQLFQQALEILLLLGHDRHLVITLIVMIAGTLSACGAAQEAARLLGAADALFAPMGVGLQRGDRGEYARSLARTEAQLDTETLHHFWQLGAALTLDEAVAQALAAGRNS
jgi:predicted ATPase